ncbi:MAG: hypothetical protein CL874_04375 [Dehalococcoidales bacterium]|nr:hypothetical protein [Dehalococcoidales bacterium]
MVVDEIGKIELFPTDFREAVRQAMGSREKVLGTIMFNPHPRADDIRH